MVIESKGSEVKSSTLRNEVMMTLRYSGTSITFPINPESLKITTDSNSTTETVVGKGQISLPQTPSLSTFSISSFFWSDMDDQSPRVYVDWLKQWQKSGKPAEFYVSKLNICMNVTCESFAYWINAGEEKDIYFSLDLMEYRSYGARPVKLSNNTYMVQNEDGSWTSVGTTTLVGTPIAGYGSGNRSKVNKLRVPESVYVDANESDVSILNRYTKDPESFMELYELNRDTMGETLSDFLTIGDTVQVFTQNRTNMVKNSEEGKKLMQEINELMQKRKNLTH